ncbi:MAG: 6-pyruvoyl trahydropterin synthase family protein [Gammaproteobacteria bacterium]
MTRSAVVEIHQDELSFSAGHFTIFTATDREDLHGHNYYVGASFNVLLNDNGLAFDYRIYKRKLLDICHKLDRKFLLAGESKYLKIEDAGDMWFAHFGKEKIPFLKRDAVILPICNATIEELSNWFLQQLIVDEAELKKYCIHGITIKVFNGPGQSGAASWGRF